MIDEPEVQTKIDHKAHIEALKAFLGSRVHVNFTRAVNRKIKETEELILNTDFIDFHSSIGFAQRKAELEVYRNFQKTFEDALDTLENLVDQQEIEEVKTKLQTEQTTENE